MSALAKDLAPFEIRHPERPEPLDFAFDRCIPWEELRFCRTQEERERLFKDLKRMAAHQLAQHIAKHCKWFDRGMQLDGSMRLTLELTINDKGAYRNWIPQAEQEGRKEGWASAMREAARSLPYGLADAASEFYE